MLSCGEDCFNCKFKDCVFDSITEKAIADSNCIEHSVHSCRVSSGKKVTGGASSYYATHRAERLAYQKEYYRKHKDACNNYQKKYYRDNRERLLAYQNAYEFEKHHS